jgi:ubiquinone biosynthesis protein Coq4
MDLLKTGPDAAPDHLRALVDVARAAQSGLGQPQCAMLDALQRVVLETAIDVETLKSITPSELALHEGDPALARQLVRFMVALSLADGPPSAAQVSLISSFARALHVEEPAVSVTAHLAKGRLLRFRLAFVRHSHVRSYLRNTRQLLGGVLPLLRAILVSRGVLSENLTLAARFHALADLPPDTLGHQFHGHFVAEGLAFPGEKGGFPLGALFHDFSHVLAGYDTSPEGELKNAAFQAGFTRDDDDFFTALFAIVIHTAGINMTPFPMPVLLGRIGQGTLAFDILLALDRGAQMKVDLGNGWDFWEDVELPIEVVREKLGVLPLVDAPASSDAAFARA